MLFIMSLNFTARGIREIKDDPKRAQAAQDLALRLDAGRLYQNRLRIAVSADR